MNKNVDIVRDAPMVAMHTLASHFETAAGEVDLTSPEYRQYLLIHAGSGVATLDGKTYSMGPGTMALVPSGSVFKLKMGRGAQGMVMSAHEEFIRSKVLPTLQVPTGIYWKTYHSSLVFHRWAGPANRAARTQIWRELEGARARLSPIYDCAIAAYVIVILCDKLSEDTSYREDASRAGLADEITYREHVSFSHLEPETAQAELVMRFRTLVEENFRQQWSIKTSCQAMGLTVARLTRACGAVLDRTPLSILHERILLEAKRELLYSSHSVSQISYGLGFAEPGYFCRFFKHHTGHTPMAFRRTRKSWSATAFQSATSPDTAVAEPVRRLLG
jgi:AraC family transcriptional activator of pobA